MPKVNTQERDRSIIDLYASGKFTTEHIARTFKLNRRQIQRIAKRGGVIRTQADANRVSAKLKSQRRVSKRFRLGMP